jgi:predicted GIY-YIG superfamily endonuclease
MPESECATAISHRRLLCSDGPACFWCDEASNQQEDDVSGWRNRALEEMADDPCGRGGRGRIATTLGPTRHDTGSTVRARSAASQQHGIKRLVWFEPHETMETAILREKRVKRWPRAWKYDLIHEQNPTWRDLAEDFGFPPLPLK